MCSHLRGVGGIAHRDASSTFQARTRAGIQGDSCRWAAAVGLISEAVRRAPTRIWRIYKCAVRVERQRSLSGQRRSSDIEYTRVVGHHALRGIRDRQRSARSRGARKHIVCVCGSVRHWHSNGWGSRTIYADVSQHAGITRDSVARQAQLTIEDGQRGAASGGHVDHHIVGLARGHKHFALHARNARQYIAVFRDQRKAARRQRRRNRRTSLRSHDRRHVHAQAGIYQPHQHCSGDRNCRGSWQRSERRGPSAALVERHPVDEVVER